MQHEIFLTNITPPNFRCSYCTDLIMKPDYTETKTCKCGLSTYIFKVPEFKKITIADEKTGFSCPYCNKWNEHPNNKEIPKLVNCLCGFYAVQYNKPVLSLPILAVTQKYRRHSFNSNSSYERFKPYMLNKRIITIKLEQVNQNFGKGVGNYHIVVRLSQTRTLDGRMENAIAAIRNAIVFNEAPLLKKRQGSYRIRDSGQTADSWSSMHLITSIHFNVDEKTISLVDNNNETTLRWDGKGFKILRMDEEKYMLERESSKFTEFLRMLSDLWGDLSAPTKMADILGKPEMWKDITATKLDDISRSSGKIYCRRHGPLVEYHRSSTSCYLHTEYQTKYGYIKDDIISDLRSEIHWIFYRKRKNAKNFNLYEVLMQSPEEIIPMYNGLDRERKEQDRNMRRAFRNMNRQNEHHIIAAAGRDRCILCGNKIHNLSAFDVIPSDLVLKDEEQRFGVLCCGCYGRHTEDIARYKQELKEVL